MPRNKDRFQTYVFDHEYDQHPRNPDIPKNAIGADYKGGTPVAWSDGHELRKAEEALQLLRDIRDGEFEDIEDAQATVEYFFENADVCY